ncbi:MAG: adenylate/guanylate cyclase domain-containing protein [Candidatus Eremiobacteraeota bacterium]|nr:adenylate/guanylate cyclase domain-containing protein [Candidatus Eremiobacteraeota bacterium]
MKKALKQVIVIIILCLINSFIVTALSGAEIFRKLEYKAYDLLFISRGIRKPDDGIVIIGINEQSLKKIKKPVIFWGQEIAEIIGGLSNTGARVVGLDILQLTSLDEYAVGLDRELALSIHEAGNVVLPCILEYDSVKKGYRVIEPIPLLKYASGADNIGFVTLFCDTDDFLRQQTFFIEDLDGKVQVSLPLLVASKYLGKEISVKNHSVKIGKKEIFCDNNYRNMINFAGPSHTFKNIPFHKSMEVIKNNPETFRDKIVLIGFTEKTISKDLYPTPFYGVKREGISGRLYGIEILANCINTILKNNPIRPISNLANFLIILAVSIIIGVICYYTKPVYGILITFLILLSYGVIVFQVFSKLNVYINITGSFGVAILGFASTYVYRYITEDIEKIRIQNIFKSFVSDGVAEEMLRDPSKVELGGAKRNISILFSDMNEYTPMCNKLPPENVVDILNEYFSLMEKIIFKYDGTIIQFCGDEIMIVFGAPISDDKHARNAVLTAVEMMEETGNWLKKREGESGNIFDGVKIGIHSGTVVMGIIGSKKRRQYSAVGDVINTAARLESKAKDMGGILISEDTYDILKEDAELKSRIIFENKGKHKLKGIDKLIETYSVREVRGRRLEL